MAFQAHRRTALNVEDDAVALVLGCRDWLAHACPGHGEEVCTVGPAEPGQPFPYLIGVDTATGNLFDLGRLPATRSGCAESHGNQPR